MCVCVLALALALVLLLVVLLLLLVMVAAAVVLVVAAVVWLLLFFVFAVLVVVMFIVVVAAAAAACCSLFADVAALVAFGFALAVGTQDWARSKHDTMENCRSGLATAWRPSASRWFWFRSVGRVLERALGY